ncbi:MAG: hypothetical protein Q8M95_00090 [Candidatus Methanoperedens sp.]|nr:hypothetical protein [Candidatus Methanoperedens sp.]
MPEEQLPELSEELGVYIDKPYGGLFGDNAQIKIIEEVVADPYRSYRPRYFEEMTGASAPSIRKALNTLTSLGLIDKDTSDIQHPIYRANLKSKKLVALTFLSLASIDDRDGTECMEFAILDYYFKVLNEKVQPSAAATFMKFEFQGMQFITGYVSEGGQTLRESASVAAKAA